MPIRFAAVDVDQREVTVNDAFVELRWGGGSGRRRIHFESICAIDYDAQYGHTAIKLKARDHTAKDGHDRIHISWHVSRDAEAFVAAVGSLIDRAVQVALKRAKNGKPDVGSS